MKFFAAIALALTALMPTASAAQVTIDSATMAAKFPPPATGEFGPLAEAPDGLNLQDHVQINNTPHTTGEPAASGDILGAFRFECGPGQVIADDPVVYPGKPGRSHVHQFYGNVLTNANSTYASQRASGMSTCGSQMNRSGYWIPAMISGNRVLRPDVVVIYYKREPKSSQYCDPQSANYRGICVSIPNGLRFIFGYDMISSTVTTGGITFTCLDDSNPSRPVRAGTAQSSDMVTAVKGCQVGDLLNMNIDAPLCWDGVNLDTPNHRSHTRNTEANGKCPSTHPYYMTHFTLKSFYRVDANLNTSGTWAPGQNTWYLSSDIMFGMTPRRPGTTFHADYFEAWNNRVKKAWTDNCIDKFYSCVGNDLGNGYQINDRRWIDTLPRYVPIPAGIRGPFLNNKLHAGH